MNRTADVIIAGGGIIGLASAAAISRTGRSVLIVSEARAGQASSAAAGMLAPSVEKASGPAHDFAIAARDFFPDYLEYLADETGIRVPLNRLGVLQVALTEPGVRGLQKSMGATATWIDRADLAELEPTLGHAIGAVMNADDGSVDNVKLMSALAELARKSELIQVTTGFVTAVAQTGDTVSLLLASGERLSGEHAVIAPGAWGAAIDGCKALSDVAPLRGQLISFQSIGLRHVAYGPRGYLVPRSGGTTIAGSTMENVGFVAETTPAGLAKVRSAAEEIAPGLSISPVRAEWAGLRPVTPDMLPIVGPDPEAQRIIYACGHSRNGILLAPLTGKVVASLVASAPLEHDLTQFRPGRF